MNSAIEQLRSLREELEKMSLPWASIEAWAAKAEPVIRTYWPDHLDQFKKLVGLVSWWSTYNQSDLSKFVQTKQKILNFLDGIIGVSIVPHEKTALDTVCLLCERFPTFARQLARRERKRDPLQIQDEYDVQYLMHAILRLHFDDIRPEEWAPSYAGGATRMDFLLKMEQIVVETKMTRENLADREVGEQLIVDIQKYAGHPDCRKLGCFVYDPEHRLTNPVALERDLSRMEVDLEVVVIVSPK